jgi:hypothetical protein
VGKSNPFEGTFYRLEEEIESSRDSVVSRRVIQQISDRGSDSESNPGSKRIVLVEEIYDTFGDEVADDLTPQIN